MPTLDLEKKMLRTIRRRFPVEPWKPKSPFQTLIQTILSQNTSDRNSELAMKRLRRRYKMNPPTLARADLRRLRTCIRPAGLYRLKSRRIKDISTLIAEKYHGRLERVLALPYLQAKMTLTALRGVGPKTADILLAFVSNHPVIPVDRHIARVARRIGVVKKKASYEDIRGALESLIEPRRRLEAHLSIIEFGREICKATKPLCPICPLKALCPSSTAPL